MSIIVTCRKCGETHTVDDAMAGRAFNCAQCGAKCLAASESADAGARGRARDRLGCAALIGLAGVLVALVLAPVLRPGARRRATPPEADLARIGEGLHAYARENGGFFPYDRRGPLHSLALLYPRWVAEAEVFSNPFLRNDRGERFPEGCALAGRWCSYGYDPEQPPGAATPDTPVVASLPRPDGTACYVLRRDGRVDILSGQEEMDVADDIFSADPDRDPDGDTYIRQ